MNISSPSSSGQDQDDKPSDDEDDDDESSTPATPSETPPSTPSGAGADRKIKKEFGDLDNKPPKKKARKSSIIPPPVVSNDMLSSRESRKLLEYSRRIELNTERRESSRTGAGRDTTTRRMSASGPKPKDIKDIKDLKEGKFSKVGKKGSKGKRRYADYDEEDDDEEDNDDSERENMDEDDEEGKKQNKRQRRWSDDEEDEEEDSEDEKKQTPGKGKQTPKGKRRVEEDEDEEDYDSEDDGKKHSGKGRKKMIKTPEGKGRKEEDLPKSVKPQQPTKDIKPPPPKDKSPKPPTPKTPKERLKQQQKEAAEKALVEKEAETPKKECEGEEENKSIALSRKYTRKPKDTSATTPTPNKEANKEEKPEIKVEENKGNPQMGVMSPSAPGTPTIASPTTPTTTQLGQGTPGKKSVPRKYTRKIDRDVENENKEGEAPRTPSEVGTPTIATPEINNNVVNGHEEKPGETIKTEPTSGEMEFPSLDKLPWKAESKQIYSPNSPEEGHHDPPPRGPGRPRKRVFQEPEESEDSQQEEDDDSDDDSDDSDDDDDERSANQPHKAQRAQRALNREKNKADLKKREAEEEEKKIKKKEEKMERLAENKKRRESDKQARMESKTLGHLQVIISAAITQNGGSAPFDYICNYAKKFATTFHWSVDRKRGFTRYSSTGNMSINPEVLADAVKVSLDEKSGVKFKKDPHRPGNWMLSEQPTAPATTAKKDKPQPQTKVLSSTRTVVVQPPPPAKKGRPKKGGQRGYGDSSDESSGSEEDENDSEDSRDWDEGDEEGPEGSDQESEGGAKGSKGKKGKGPRRGGRVDP